jgi:hypothetical protein
VGIEEVKKLGVSLTTLYHEKERVRKVSYLFISGVPS